MAAPLLIIPVFAALLGGAHLSPWIAGAGVAIADADGVTVDLDRLCKATDPLLDALADRAGSTRWLTTLARAADRICAAAAAGPGFATDIQVVAAALQAIGSAEAVLRAGAVAIPVPDVSARKKTGR
jgi:hypothetical protein